MTVGYIHRLRLALFAGLTGWGAGFAASAPSMAVIGWRDSEHSLFVFAATIGYGLSAWALWTLLLGLVAWALFAVPIVLLVSPRWLVRHRFEAMALAVCSAALAVSMRLHHFRDLSASRTALRFILYMPYGVFALVFALVTAWRYIRGVGRGTA